MVVVVAVVFVATVVVAAVVAVVNHGRDRLPRFKTGRRKDLLLCPGDQRLISSDKKYINLFVHFYVCIIFFSPKTVSRSSSTLYFVKNIDIPFSQHKPTELVFNSCSSSQMRHDGNFRTSDNSTRP